MNDDSIAIINGDSEKRNLMTDNAISEVEMNPMKEIYCDVLKSNIPEAYSLEDCREAHNIVMVA